MKTMLEAAEKNQKSEFDLMEQKFGQIKMENHRYVVDLKKTADDLKTEGEILAKIKVELTDKMEANNKHTNDVNSNTVERCNRVNTEFDSIKSRFGELAEFIKDIRFKKNINDMYSYPELKNVSERIAGKQPTQGHGNSSNHYNQSHHIANKGSTDLPNIHTNQHFQRSEHHKTSHKEKDTEKVPVKLNKKKSLSNVNLPKVVIEESPTKEPLDSKEGKGISEIPAGLESADISPTKTPLPNMTANTFFPHAALGNKEEVLTKNENELKSKSLYDNKIFKSKMNTQMSTSNYNSTRNDKPDSKRDNNPSKENVNFVQRNKMTYKYNNNKVTTTKPKQGNYSLERLEPDFNFKTAMLQFDPFQNTKKVNKYAYNPVQNKNVIVEYYSNNNRTTAELDHFKKRSRS